jgi:hypothetical protein
MQAAELAASLVEEALAFMFGVIVDEAIARSVTRKRESADPPYYPLSTFRRKGSSRSTCSNVRSTYTRNCSRSEEPSRSSRGMSSDVDALAAALRTHLGS